MTNISVVKIKADRFIIIDKDTVRFWMMLKDTDIKVLRNRMLHGRIKKETDQKTVKEKQSVGISVSG